MILYDPIISRPVYNTVILLHLSCLRVDLFLSSFYIYFLIDLVIWVWIMLEEPCQSTGVCLLANVNYIWIVCFRADPDRDAPHAHAEDHAASICARAAWDSAAGWAQPQLFIPAIGKPAGTTRPLPVLPPRATPGHTGARERTQLCHPQCGRYSQWPGISLSCVG